MRIILKDDNDDLLLKREGKGVRVFDSLKGIIESDYWVDMGLPSGTLWAKANIDVTTDSGLTEVNGEISPYTYVASFFSWGNTDGHTPNSEHTFDYTFDSTNYDSTSGKALTGNIPPSQDAAVVNLGKPWRMPSTEDFSELLNSNYTQYVNASGTVVTATNKEVTINGVKGVCLMSKINGNTLFLPCCGHSSGNAQANYGSRGYYWKSTMATAANGRCYRIQTSGITANHSVAKYYGFPIRPVI